MQDLINQYFINKKIDAFIIETIKSDNYITFKIQLNDILSYKKFNKTMEKELSYLLGNKATLKVDQDILIIINDKKAKTEKLSGVVVPLGVDTFGNIINVDFSKNPHWLCGGSTGSGKSVFLNNVINELLKNYKNDCQFMFIDLKRVEFAKYEKLEQNILHVANDLSSAISVLDYAITIMNNRYNLYEKQGFLNIEEYNDKQPDGQKNRYTFLLIDELAELMLLDKNAIQDRLQRLLQLGRAAGVYVISATQRPDSNVLAGTLKVNYTTRICFKVSSVYDSKTIINQTGGELLKGSGDGLILQNGSSEVVRFQAYPPCSDDVLKANYIEKITTTPDITFSSSPNVPKIKGKTKDVDILGGISKIAMAINRLFRGGR